MQENLDGHSRRFGVFLRHLTAVSLSLLAFAVFVAGWLVDVPAFVRPDPSAPAMVALTAISFGLLFAALLLRRIGPAAHVWPTGLAIALATSNLSVIVLGEPLGLEAYLPLPHAAGDRMSPITSLAVILGGLAILQFGTRRHALASNLGMLGLSSAVCMICLTAGNLTGPALFAPLAGLSLYTELFMAGLFTLILIEA